MVFPEHTISGQKFRKWYLKDAIDEVEREGIANPEIYPDWLPMYREMLSYIFLLEERIRRLEES